MSRYVADSLNTISIEKFNYHRLLKLNPDNQVVQGTIVWSSEMFGIKTFIGEVSFRLNYEFNEPSNLIFTYRIKDSPNDSHILVSLKAIQCNYGGKRWFFVCPNENCDHICGKLYQLKGQFLCRLCHELTYASNNRSKLERSLHNAFKYNLEFGNESKVYARQYYRAKRYPIYKNQPTKAASKVQLLRQCIPSPIDQLNILNKYLYT